VVVALLHDIGESLGPFNHGEVIAAVLRPFIADFRGRENNQSSDGCRVQR
jgi:predicted HD phosphohydrolase